MSPPPKTFRPAPPLVYLDRLRSSGQVRVALARDPEDPGFELRLFDADSYPQAVAYATTVAELISARTVIEGGPA